MADAPMTVVETAEFLKRAKGLMTDLEREALVAFVGANPEAGEVVPETGGVRKIRWGLKEWVNVAARAWANLSKAEWNAMKRLVPALVAGYPKKG